MATKKGKPGQISSAKSHSSLPYLVDDLCARFVLNCPPEELKTFPRMCFQMELAHWFYEDYYRENDQSLPKLNIREFITLVFRQCSLLRQYKDQVDSILLEWVQYKLQVPVYGVILLNEAMDKVLLVKGFQKSASWGFPKGKMNKDEPEIDCAAREAWEETGLDLADMIIEEDFVEASFNRQSVKLFIVSGVPEGMEYKAQTKGEISKIKWYWLKDLPSNYNDTGKEYKPNQFYTVVPFVQKLKTWIKRRKNEKKGAKKNKGALAVKKGGGGGGGSHSHVHAVQDSPREDLHRYSPLKSSLPLPSQSSSPSESIKVLQKKDDNSLPPHPILLPPRPKFALSLSLTIPPLQGESAVPLVSSHPTALSPELLSNISNRFSSLILRVAAQRSKRTELVKALQPSLPTDQPLPHPSSVQAAPVLPSQAEEVEESDPIQKFLRMASSSGSISPPLAPVYPLQQPYLDPRAPPNYPQPPQQNAQPMHFQPSYLGPWMNFRLNSSPMIHGFGH